MGATNSNTIMATSYGVQGLGSLGSAYAESQALRAQGEYQRDMAEINARFAKIQADDALKRGEKSVSAVRQKGKQVVGSQRAALAAQGIDADYGTASDLQRDTEEAVAKDIMTIRNNAWREAWGFKVGAQNILSQGRVAEIAGRTRAGSTLLTGGLQTLGYGARAVGSYYSKPGSSEG